MTDAIVTTDHISKRFGQIVALEDISLEIKRGELFGLLGPNGAGKTTLLSILSTILPATSGSAAVCGYDVRKSQDEVRKSIGIVFQDPSLDDELTGQENLDFHGRLYGLGKARRQSEISNVLELVDLKDRRHDIVKTYSGGMRRRLEIARGLMHRPQLLFLDEPTLGLDPQTRRKIWNYIGSLKESHGMTIILTTHYMDEADQLCSRIAVIDKGRIIALDTPEKLKDGLGGDLLEMELSEIKQDLISELENFEEISSIVVEHQKIAVTVKNGDMFIPRMFDVTRRFGVGIASVSVRKPKLEDVFIKLTGREIRDDGAIEPRDRIRIFMRSKSR